MALKVLNIQDEVSCPICLELLTESLTLDCGHSFCQACITMNTKEVEISPGEESSCPVCGVRFSLGNLWPNQHLVNIMERIREFRLNAEEELKRDLCVRHEEKLRLFCKEDRKVICWLCERSPEHRGHHTFLVEEVVKECQEKLQAALERLRKEQQKAEKLEADIREERTSWKYQVQTERQRIWTEFSQLRSVLDSEEQRELQKLEEEEKRILDSLAEAEAELAQQNQLVKELISDLEHRREWSTVDLLQVRGMPQFRILETQSKLPSFLCPWAPILVLTLRGSFVFVEPFFVIHSRYYGPLNISIPGECPTLLFYEVREYI
ncbi:tripartite motif-containing protein 34 [Ailuropoda melanoleuca]|uniref:Tripartite motif-containing protein 34 n=1 Tax=Ailuropoda melanoleuca TaxID=9646 RepID=A0A7N5P0I2_AILME|nr:tripartite motif-containing protein 34 [Ailuropoda melanoleuca]